MEYGFFIDDMKEYTSQQEQTPFQKITSIE